MQSKNHYLGMKEGDLADKPYAKYWNPEMQPLQPQVQAGVAEHLVASELGLELDQIDQLLKPGVLALENGVTQLGSGRYYVACQTNMPGVTGEMFEWWMGWHYMENQRYKLWHPNAHLANGTAEMQGDNPKLSNRQKYETTHLVTEYMGRDAADITITFAPATQYFKTTDDPYSEQVTALVCGRIALRRPAMTIGHVIHQIRELETGAEMRSRFWLGKPQLSGKKATDLRNRFLGARWVTNTFLPKRFAHDVLVHCGMEMNHLASFLPALYRDYHS